MELTREEKITIIINGELEMSNAVFIGHKANTGDQFTKTREVINQLRLELEFIKASGGHRNLKIII